MECLTQWIKGENKAITRVDLKNSGMSGARHISPDMKIPALPRSRSLVLQLY